MKSLTQAKVYACNKREQIFFIQIAKLKRFSTLKNSTFPLNQGIKVHRRVLLPCLFPVHCCEKSARESRNSHHLMQSDNIHARPYDTCVERRGYMTSDSVICSKNRKIVPNHRSARIPRLTVSVPDYGFCLDLTFVNNPYLTHVI